MQDLFTQPHCHLISDQEICHRVGACLFGTALERLPHTHQPFNSCGSSLDSTIPQEPKDRLKPDVTVTYTSNCR